MTVTGIWKTGVLAAVITVIAATIVMRTGERSNLTSNVHVTNVIPQIVRGGGYRTFIQIINEGSSSVTVNADFYNQIGTPSALQFTKDDLNGHVTPLAGSMKGATVAAGGILVLDFENTGSG